MSANHTAEPWVIARDDRPGMAWNNHIVSADRPNMTICFMTHDGTPENVTGEANARRIVAAVNALAGYPTEHLESLTTVLGETITDRVKALCDEANQANAQRDELLAALKALRSSCFDRRDANSEFERLGELYYREFGRLRPGKDDPMRDSSDPENVKQYEDWSRARAESAFDLADAAIAKAEGREVAK